MAPTSRKSSPNSRLFHLIGTGVAGVSLAHCGAASLASGQPDAAGMVVVRHGAVAAKPQVKAVASPAMPGVNVPAVKVNTVGYPTGWRKLAIFNVEPKAPLVRDAQGRVVLEIAADNVEARGVDAASQDAVWQVDFSVLENPGTYTVEGEGVKSDPFEIGDGVYRKAFVAGMKHFYFQRTRMALELPYAEWEGTSYTRAKPSHVHADVGWDLEDYPAKKRKWNVEGGWHDAGNYDMYIPSTAPTAQGLLMAYEWNPSLFLDGQLNIPESGNKIPDLLDEARWGLIWVLSMQEESGAFRHREAVMKWSPEKPADEDRTVRWIAGVSTAATAKAVAALALAARVYKPWDGPFATRCETAARKGWAFLQANPKRILVDGKGSEQTVWDDNGEFTAVGAKFVAATEMWASFGDASALALATELADSKEAQPTELIKGAWANLSRWALGNLALNDKTPVALRQKAQTLILSAAELLRQQIQQSDGYRCASKPEDYYWASNSQLMEKAHILLMASRVAPDQPWLVEAARDQWHWILGRNPNGYSMVTRIGKGPDRLYHMEWGASEPPPPGYLIGGPNHQNMGFLAPNAPAKALLWDNPELLSSGLPAHSMWHWRQSDLWDGGFVDHDKWTDGWWAVTESDIYYNANLVLVAVAMQQ